VYFNNKIGHWLEIGVAVTKDRNTRIQYNIVIVLINQFHLIKIVYI